MKIKMKLLLLCAAVAPFLLMTSSQQNGSRFGCVCAMEKFPESGIGSRENCSSSSHQNENAPAPALEFCDRVPDNLIEIFNQNMNILEIYDSKNNTLGYFYFKRIVSCLAKDKGDSIESFKNQPENKSGDWLDFCFMSAILEGILASCYQKFESMESCIKQECQDFPFAELKKLTCSMWPLLESSRFRPNDFYHVLIDLMHCREREFFDFICCLADVRSPYMQLFIACLMHIACALDANVEWDKLINIMNKNPDRMDSDDVFRSILSCFYFESKLNQALRNFYLRVLKQKAANRDGSLVRLVVLSNLRCADDVDVPQAINWIAENFLRFRLGRR